MKVLGLASVFIKSPELCRKSWWPLSYHLSSTQEWLSRDRPSRFYHNKIPKYLLIPCIDALAALGCCSFKNSFFGFAELGDFVGLVVLVGWLVTRYCRDYCTRRIYRRYFHMQTILLVKIDLHGIIHGFGYLKKNASLSNAVWSILEQIFPPFLYNGVVIPKCDSPFQTFPRLGFEIQQKRLAADKVGIGKRKKSLDVHPSLP